MATMLSAPGVYVHNTDDAEKTRLYGPQGIKFIVLLEAVAALDNDAIGQLVDSFEWSTRHQAISEAVLEEVKILKGKASKVMVLEQAHMALCALVARPDAQTMVAAATWEAAKALLVRHLIEPSDCLAMMKPIQKLGIELHAGDKP
jgi:hypothetical protein